MRFKFWNRNKIKVSILCQSYNQEQYIQQALESFVTQKTNFKFEVLIHDDASTDQTSSIVKKFKNKYPSIIKPFFQEKNQYSQGIRGFVLKYLIPKSKGEYLIVCDGDDYFCDDNKLQLQVDYLEQNPDYAICFHPVRVFFENNLKPEYLYPDIIDPDYFTLLNLILDNFIQTNSAMYRRQNYKDLTSVNMIPNDWYLHLYHAKYGKIGFINKIMSTYRKHPKGIWWDSAENTERLYKKNGILILIMHYEVYKLFKFNTEYKNILLNKINILTDKVMNLLHIDSETLFNKHLSDYVIENVEFNEWRNL